MFKLPQSVYQRFEGRSGNKQSQLLQEVKGVLARSYNSTDIKGDGPVVLVSFSAFKVEVIPSFILTNGQFYICMTDNNGRYKTADYDAEISSIANSEKNTNGNTRNLVRMMKCWQRECSVSIKSFWIEITAVNFLSGWSYKDKSKEYYDWMVRDYLEYLVGQKGCNVYAPGTYEIMNLGSLWESKAKSALVRAKKACEYGAANKDQDAGDEWQKIFGTDMPRNAP